MGDKTLGLKGASPADKQAAQVASNIIKHEGKKGSAVEDRKNEDRNPVTGKVETHTRLATPEEGEKIRRGEKVEGKPGDQPKGKKVKSDQEAMEAFIDPANAKAEGKSSKEGEEGSTEAAEAANARALRSAVGTL